VGHFCDFLKELVVDVLHACAIVDKEGGVEGEALEILVRIDDRFPRLAVCEQVTEKGQGLRLDDGRVALDTRFVESGSSSAASVLAGGIPGTGSDRKRGLALCGKNVMEGVKPGAGDVGAALVYEQGFGCTGSVDDEDGTFTDTDGEHGTVDGGPSAEGFRPVGTELVEVAEDGDGPWTWKGERALGTNGEEEESEDEDEDEKDKHRWAGL
jgi:hypothetical protein